MPNTTPFDFGDVVLVPFPFTDQTATKKRPAVIISSSAYHKERLDLLLMAITSQVRASQTVGEVVLDHWQAAGLLKPSVLKPLIATIERPLVIRRLGKLQADDRARLLSALDKIIGE